MRGRDAARARYTLVSELLHTIPGSFFYSRKGFTMKQVCAHASERGFTNIIVLNESRKTPCSLVMSHLPAGETAPPCARAFNPTARRNPQPQGPF